MADHGPRSQPIRGYRIEIGRGKGARRILLEQAGRRPVLVVSPEAYNRKVGLALLCPITNRAKGYPYEVLLPKGLNVSGAILSDQVKSLDWRVRQAKRICDAPDEVTEEVLAKLKTLAG